MLIIPLLNYFMYLYIWQSNLICSLVNVKNFTGSRIYSISSKIEFMRFNLINMNGIFAHKSHHMSLMGESLVKTPKISCAKDISKIWVVSRDGNLIKAWSPKLCSPMLRNNCHYTQSKWSFVESRNRFKSLFHFRKIVTLENGKTTGYIL